MSRTVFRQLGWGTLLITIGLAWLVLLQGPLWRPEAEAFEPGSLYYEGQGFYRLEDFEGRPGHFIAPEARFWPALGRSEAWQLRAALRTPGGVPTTTAALSFAGRHSVELPVEGQWRHYHLLVPTRSEIGATPQISLGSTGQKFPRDDRVIGAIVSGVGLRPLDVGPDGALAQGLVLALLLLALAVLGRRDLPILAAAAAICGPLALLQLMGRLDPQRMLVAGAALAAAAALAALLQRRRAGGRRLARLATAVGLGAVLVLAAGAGLVLLALQGLAAIGAVLALLCYAGFGATWLLRSWRLLPILPYLTPLVGLALLSAIGHALGYLPFGTDRTALLVVGLIGLANVVAWRRGARPTFGRAARWSLGPALLALALGLLALCQVGYYTTPGFSTDALAYIFRAEHLQQHGLMVMPSPSQTQPPFTQAVRVFSVDGMRLGDVYVLALISSLSGARPHIFFLPQIIATTMLAASMVALLGRYLLSLDRRAGLALGLLVASQPLLHWPALNNQTSQAVGMGMWPACLLVGWVALRAGGRSLALAGMLMAGLSSVYGLHLILAGGVLGLLALYECLRRARGSADWRSSRLRALARSLRTLGLRALVVLAALALTIPFSLVLNVRQYHAMSAALSRSGSGVGGDISRFPHLGEIIGLINHAVDGYLLRLPQLSYPLATALLLLAAGVALYGLLDSRARPRWAGLSIALVFGVTLGYERFWVQQGHGYPYGYYKIVAMAAPAALLLLVSGAARLQRRLRHAPPQLRHTSRAVLRLLAAGLLALGLFYTSSASAEVNRRMLAVTDAMLELPQINQHMPPDEPLLLLNQTNPDQVWEAYLLQRSQLYSRAPSLSFWLPLPRLVRYALISRHKYLSGPSSDPAEPWFSDERRSIVWQNRDFLLVRRKDDVAGELLLASAGMRLPLTTPLQIDVGQRALTVRGVPPPLPAYKKTLAQSLAVAPARLDLALDVAAPSTLELTENGKPRRVELAPGPQTLSVAVGPNLALQLRALSGTLNLDSVRVRGAQSDAGR